MSPLVAAIYNLFLSHLRLFDFSNRSMLPCLSLPAVLADQVVKSGATCMGCFRYTRLWALSFSGSPWPSQVPLRLASRNWLISIQHLPSSYRKACRGLVLQRRTELWNTGSPMGLLNPLMSSLRSRVSVNQSSHATENASYLSEHCRHAGPPA